MLVDQQNLGLVSSLQSFARFSGNQIAETAGELLALLRSGYGPFRPSLFQH